MWLEKMVKMTFGRTSREAGNFSNVIVIDDKKIFKVEFNHSANFYSKPCAARSAHGFPPTMPLPLPLKIV